MEHDICVRPVYKNKNDMELMKVLAKDPDNRCIEKLRSIVPLIKQIKFFAQKHTKDLILRKFEGIMFYRIVYETKISKTKILPNSLETRQHQIRVYMPKGSVVIREGEVNHEFYILLIGKVTVYISDTFDKNLNYAGLKKVEKKSIKDLNQNTRELLEGKYEFMKLKPGDSFGNNAIVKDMPSAETIYCTTNCHFCTLSKQKFNEILLKIEQKRHHSWKIFFKSIPVFESLTLNTIEKLFYLTELVKFNKGDTIFKQGDHAKGFYVVYEGIVSISKKVESYFKNNININSYFDQTHHENEELNSCKASDIDNFKALYHLTINDSKQRRKECRIKELKTEGSGQFIGIEDAVLKYSKHSCSIFEYTAVCKSAEVFCFFFDKQKAYDKLNYLGCMEKIIDLAKDSKQRLENLEKRSKWNTACCCSNKKTISSSFSNNRNWFHKKLTQRLKTRNRERVLSFQDEDNKYNQTFNTGSLTMRTIDQNLDNSLDEKTKESSDSITFNNLFHTMHSDSDSEFNSFIPSKVIQNSFFSSKEICNNSNELKDNLTVDASEKATSIPLTNRK